MSSHIDKEHYSLIQTFKTAPWVFCKQLWTRIPICILFGVWFIWETYLTVRALSTNSAQDEGIVSLFAVVNFVCIPLHTLLVCRAQIDKLYILYLVGSGLGWFIISIRAFTGSTFDYGKTMYAIFSLSFLIWSVPTRILYYKTFQLAKQELGVDTTTLYTNFIVPWLWMFSIIVIMIVLIFVSATFFPTYAECVRLCAEAIGASLVTLFEIFMYSKIDPFTWMRKLGKNFIEKFYLTMSFLLLISGFTVLIYGFVQSDGTLPNWVSFGEWVFIKVVMIVRFILLWYYCESELDYYYKCQNLLEDKTIDLELQAHLDVVNVQCLTRAQIEEMEV